MVDAVIAANAQRPRRRKLASRIPGLDQILAGGWMEGGLYLVHGPAGAGKTILAFQAGVECALHGGRVLYTSLLAESHGKLIEHIEGFAFFDAELIARQFILTSAYDALRRDGLQGLLRQVAQAIATQRPQLLIIDGFSVARLFAIKSADYGQFVLQLGAIVTAARCTTLLLSPSQLEKGGEDVALVDGILELTTLSRGMRRSREIEVVKLRGGDPITGLHPFVITRQGIRIYPRLEALRSEMQEEQAEALATRNPPIERRSSGMPQIDALLDGGLLPGCVTSIMGAPGTGKTILSMKFLEAGLARGEPGLYVGFYESPARLLAKADSLGIALRAHHNSGQLRIEWHRPFEMLIDELAERILAAIDAAQIKRVVIDSIEGLRDTAMRPERVAAFCAALLSQFKARGVTTYLTEELDLFATEVATHDERISTYVENIILLRYVEVRSEMRRLISIMKARATNYDSTIREFRIDDSGVVIGEPFRHLERVLSGQARLVAHRPGLRAPKPPKPPRGA